MYSLYMMTNTNTAIRPPRTLKQVKADPRVSSVEFCDYEGRYFVELADGWTEDTCIGFSARTVKELIATLCRCVREGSEEEAPKAKRAELLDLEEVLAQLRADSAENDRRSKALRGRN